MMTKKITTLELTYSAIFICLMAIGANITFWFPFLAITIGSVSVPLSLQTFVSTLAGLFLGKRVGTFAMLGYILLGLIGVPVYAQMQAGPYILISYTGGFLISFIFVAYISGWLAEKMTVSSMKTTTIISWIGVLVNYLIGVSYMYIAMNTWLGLTINYQTAWLSMIPFLVKDAALGFIAALVINKVISRVPVHVHKY